MLLIQLLTLLGKAISMKIKGFATKIRMMWKIKGLLEV